MDKFQKTWFLHPLLFAAFPVLFLYAENIRDVSFKHVWGIFAAVLFAGGILLLAGLLLFRNKNKAGIFASVFIALFLLYRPVYTFFQKPVLFQALQLDRHRVLATLFLLLIGFISYKLFKTKKPLQKLTTVISVTAFLLLLPTVFKIAWHQLSAGTKPVVSERKKISIAKAFPKQRPDIYYFVLDSYGRQDVLKNMFGYNNAPFLAALKQRGFYIADSSISNYWQTRLSVASSLNMDYLHRLPGFPQGPHRNPKILSEYIANSAVRKLLAGFGYKFVAFATGSTETEIKNADVYYKPAIWFELNDFNASVLNFTPVPDLLTLLYNKSFMYEAHRLVQYYPFQEIPKKLPVKAPKFVFVHSLLLHPPFITGPNGESIAPNRPFGLFEGASYFENGGTEQEYRDGYRNQLPVLNKWLLQTVDSIIAHSETPPIILLQGDHSSRMHLLRDEIDALPHHEIYPVLNAFYLPKADTGLLYKSISPVNTFRFISNQYFGSALPLFPDKAYYSRWADPLTFTEVTDRINKPAKSVTPAGSRN